MLKLQINLNQLIHAGKSKYNFRAKMIPVDLTSCQHMYRAETYGAMRGREAIEFRPLDHRTPSGGKRATISGSRHYWSVSNFLLTVDAIKLI